MQWLLKVFKPKNFIRILLNPGLVFAHLKYAISRIFYDLLFIFYRKHKFNIVFIAGLPMSATTKIKNMLGKVPGYFTRYTPMPYDIAVNQDICQSAFRYVPSWSYTLFKTHLNPWEKNINLIKKNNVKKVIVSYRDLRDVVIARYNRLIKFPKKKYEPYYAEYHNMKKEDAINHCIEVVGKNYPKWIYGWFKVSKANIGFVHFCRFEDLVTKPKSEFIKMLNFYNITIDNDKIDQIVKETEGQKNMEINVKEALILPWAHSSNFRSGKIGSWKKEFSSSNIDYFKEIAGFDLIKLNYEKDLNW
jgi:hypothetical protein